MSGPNALTVAAAALWAMRVRFPRHFGTATADHEGLGPVLDSLAAGRAPASLDEAALRAYLTDMQAVPASELTRDHALAYWLNLYNALAVDLVREAHASNSGSVLDLRLAFERRIATVEGTRLSLTDIEHGKIRRFGDPRIHGALVCGSLSCPTLRPEPFEGDRVEDQLEDQMRSFVSSGAVFLDRASETVSLSRVFLWYGADFARPHRMPTWIPARRRDIGRAAVSFLGPDAAEWFEDRRPSVRFQPYDWGLGCAVA